MRGRSLDDRGTEGPNLFGVVVVDLRFGVEEPGRVLKISVCFRRLSEGVPLEEEAPVILSQLAVSSSGQEVNEPLLADVFRSCRVLPLHFVEDKDFAELCLWLGLRSGAAASAVLCILFWVWIPNFLA